MIGLRSARKRLVAAADVAARNRGLRTIAQTIPLLRLFDGGFHRGPAASAARGPWRALVLGAPRSRYAAIDQAFPEFRKQFVVNRVSPDALLKELAVEPAPAILVWGVSGGSQLRRLQALDISPYPVFHISPGPVDLGDGEAGLRSYVIDWTGLYSNARRPSDLETILNYFPFSDHPSMIADMRKHGARLFPRSDRSGPVVVACQDRSDPAAAFAGRLHPETEELIALARAAHPGERIALFQVCPREKGRAAHRASLEKLGDVVPAGEEAAVLGVCRHLYTGSADVGFEALMRRIPVTTVGAPFYAGWGLTEDRRPAPRRERALNRYELAAAVLLLYSRFLGPGGLVQPMLLGETA